MGSQDQPQVRQVESVDRKVEARLVRKLDLRVASLVTFLYFLAYLDRTNIGNAKIAGMAKDLKLTDGQYRWLLTIFYVAYVAFEWMALMWKRVPPHRWAAICVFGFGLMSTLQAVVGDWSSFMAVRFLLGAFEAGYGPGIPYLLSFFYLRNELGVRIGWYAAAAAFASCMAGALAYGITQAKSSLAPWKLLFIVEGVPSMLAGIATWFLLPDSPGSAKFLTEEEKTVARARALRQVGDEEGAHRIGKIQWDEVLSGLTDIKNWITAVMYFSEAVCFSSLPVFLPTVLTEMGFSFINSQGLSAPPYFIAGVLAIVATMIGDRLQQRGYPIAIFSILGAVGYILIAATSSVGSRYTGAYLAAAGVYPAIGNTVPWVLNNQPSDTKRGTGIMILNVLGQCGPIAGMNIFPAREGPYYRMGMGLSAGFMVLNAVLALTLRWMLVQENKKLDALYGPTRQPSEVEGENGEALKPDASVPAVGLEVEGPSFRYVL